MKKAYRKKARENHPDLNRIDPAAAERMNRINEAYDRIMNPEKYAARDRRAGAAGVGARVLVPGDGYAGGAGGYGQGSQGSGQGQGYQQGGQGYGTEGPYGWTGGFGFDDLFGFGGAGAASNEPIHPEPSASDSASVRQAVAAINAGDFQQAVGIQRRGRSSGRDARWHYLAAPANQGAGNILMALELIRKAVQMDPGNPDYQRAQRQFQRAGTEYREEGQAQGFSMGFMDPEPSAAGYASPRSSAACSCPTSNERHEHGTPPAPRAGTTKGTRIWERRSASIWAPRTAAWPWWRERIPSSSSMRKGSAPRRAPSAFSKEGERLVGTVALPPGRHERRPHASPRSSGTRAPTGAPTVDGKAYHAAGAVPSMILRKLRHRRRGVSWEPGVTDAVVTVPAYFNDMQRQADRGTPGASRACNVLAHHQRAHGGRARLQWLDHGDRRRW